MQITHFMQLWMQAYDAIVPKVLKMGLAKVARLEMPRSNLIVPGLTHITHLDIIAGARTLQYMCSTWVHICECMKKVSGSNQIRHAQV